MAERINGVMSAEEGRYITRNNGFRKQFKVVTEKIAEGILKVNPDFNPNVISFASGVLTTIAVIAATRKLLRGEISFEDLKGEAGLLIGAQVLDGVDGSVATVKNRKTPAELAWEKEHKKKLPEKHNTTVGGSVDAGVDRGGALVMGAARIVVSFLTQRGWRKVWGVTAAVTSTLTGVRGSQLRAAEEEQGKTVPETTDPRKDPLGFGGTHLWRTVFAVPATLFPSVRGFPVQAIIDTFLTAENLVVIRRRQKGGEPILLPERGQFDEGEKGQEQFEKSLMETKEAKDKIIKDATLRKKVLLWAERATIVGVGVSLGAAAIAHFIDNRSQNAGNSTPKMG